MIAPVVKGKRRKPRRRQPGRVRIIGGRWRSSYIDLAALPGLHGLRPTPSRVRETVFNWLAPRIRGALCLDLFAGSGALGFEAVSRGAAAVIMLDKKPAVIAMLEQNRARLAAAAVRIIRADALDWLARNAPKNNIKYDIVFLDPPFDSKLLVPACRLLASGGFLRNDAAVYMETGRGDADDNILRQGWTAMKAARSGQVDYGLYAYSGAEVIDGQDRHLSRHLRPDNKGP